MNKTISFDIDGVLADANYTGSPQEAWAQEYWDVAPRWRWEPCFSIREWIIRNKIIVISQRPAEFQAVTENWFALWGFPKFPIYCYGKRKNDLLRWIDPVLHFDDNPKHDIIAGFRHVWHPSWGEPVLGQLTTWKQIIEEVVALE